jgi:hypothetical protein
LHHSDDRPAKFQLRPKARTRDFPARATVISGATQYSLLRMTTLSLFRLPWIGCAGGWPNRSLHECRPTQRCALPSVC